MIHQKIEDGNPTREYDFEYDGRGNLQYKYTRNSDHDGRFFSYDTFGRLKSYSDTDTNEVETTYEYYADGSRKSKATAGTTYQYYYSGSTVINETKQTGTQATQEYASNILGTGGIIGRDHSLSNIYFMKNAHGDVLGAYAGNGITKVADYTYDAWNNITNGGHDNKPSLKTLNNKRANELAQKNGFKDAHDFKQAIVGKNNISKFNIKIDKNTGEIYLESIKRGGAIIATGYYQ